MRENLLRTKQFSRRAFMLGAGKVTLLSVLGMRAYYLQVIEGQRYQSLADGNRVRLQPIIPSRGRIVDRNGEVLARGQESFHVLYDSDDWQDASAIISRVMDILAIEQVEERKNILASLEEGKSGDIVVIASFVSWEKVAKIEVATLELDGIRIISPEMRFYPHGEDYSHIIGYTGVPSQEDFDDSELYGSHYHEPEFRLGKTGLEKVYEAELRGEAGVRQMEVNARGRFIKELEIAPGHVGHDLPLTIDHRLQAFVMEKLAGRGGVESEAGSAVVIDIHNGDVLAMGSVPSYDANDFIRGVDQTQWSGLLNDPDKPLLNKTVSATYPPGSTFKTVTALTALRLGVIDPEKTYYCNGALKFGDRKFHCWKAEGHGHLNMYDALAHSCNIYFYQLAKQIDVDEIAKTARLLGLGDNTGIELESEKNGLVPDRNWKKGAFDKPWYRGETLSVAIGQGSLLATPLQIAVMAARLASGKKVEPFIVKHEGGSFFASGEYDPDHYDVVILDNGKKILLPKSQREFSDLGLSNTHLEHVREGMRRVANETYGTVYRNRITEKGFEMAGKTGTAQVSNRRFKHLPSARSKRHHALFMGYAPIHAPRYAVGVVIEHGGYGSVEAAPVGRDILHKAQELGIV